MDDAKKQLLKKDIAEALKIDFNVRAVGLKAVINYIRKKVGPEKFSEFCQELKEAGFEMPVSDNILDMNWVPASWPTILMLATYRIFDWTDDDIYKMGYEHFAFSGLTKIFFKFFVSPKMSFEKAAKKWNSHFSRGRFQIENIDLDRRTASMRIYDFNKLHVTCVYLRGTIVKFIELATGSHDAAAVETKCPYQGDDYHEFNFTW